MDDRQNEVTPTEWMHSNRVGFTNWMYETFHPSKYADTSAALDNNTIRLFPNQRLVRDYLQTDSPYRGLLLYHGLGVGKTCASIAAAEGFLRSHKKVYVMLPASLAPNYKREIMRCASVGNPSEMLWNLVEIPYDKETEDSKILHEEFGLTMTYIKKHKGKVWIPRLPDSLRGGSLKKEKVPWKTLKAAEQQHVATFMDVYIDFKYEFISYNGIKERQVDAIGKHAFDESIIIIDEAHNFISRFVNGGKVAKKLYHKLMDAKDAKVVLLSGTPIINHPFELSALLNLIRGKMIVYEMALLKAASMPQEGDVIEALKSTEWGKYIDTIRLKVDSRKVHVTLLPHGFVHSEETDARIVKKRWPKAEGDMIEPIHEILMKKFKVGKRLITREEYALPSDKEKFNELFLDESDPDNPKVKNSDMFMRRILGTVSYFRSAGEEYFPTVLPRTVHKLPMTPFQFARYIDIRQKERRMESRKGPPTGLFQKKGTVYRAFSRMACNYTFPDEVKRPFPKDLRKELEKEISHNEDDDVATSEAKKEEAKKKATKTYDEKLNAALEDLYKNKTSYLQTSKLESLYSPKFAMMLKDIEESPGSCLMYSQFRTVEGIGIYRKVLETAGYVEIALEKKGREWIIANADKILSPVYKSKRFVVFQEDREKTDILMKIFNSQWSELPNSIQYQLQGIKDNLYGEVAKVMMISQSGAEGISLRNVRRVLITEPFWNMVRIDQVIGRAIRTRSHDDLPKEHRNVQVFVYMATFTAKQLKQDFTLQRLDHSMSSDEHIMLIAERKDAITKSFLNMMKQASIDCMTHAAKNKTTSSGLQCYAFPINMAISEKAFEESLEEEIANISKQKFVRSKKVQGRVVKNKDGVKYVVLDDRQGLFDYQAYKEAGVLVPAIV